MAPPHTLVLSESTFMPFYKEKTKLGGPPEVTPDYLHTTGDTLALRERGQAQQREFERTVLEPAMVPLLRHADWAAFADALAHAKVDDAEMAEWLQAHAQWQQARELRKATRAAWSAGLPTPIRKE